MYQLFKRFIILQREFPEKLFLGKQAGYKRLNCAQEIAETFKQKYSFIIDLEIMNAINSEDIDAYANN